MAKNTETQKHTNPIIILLAIGIFLSLASLSLTWFVSTESGGSIAGIITGKATGTTDLTQGGTAGVSTSDDSSISFGSGYYNPGCTTGAAILNSYNPASTPEDSPTCWVDSSGYPSTADYHSLVNSGSVPVTVDVDPSVDAEDFLCGSGETCSTGLEEVQVLVQDLEEGSCLSGLANSSFNVLATSGSTNTVTLCEELTYVDATDSLAVYVNLTVPFDARSGSKSMTFTYTATAI